MRVPLPIESERLTIREFRPEADAEPMLAVYGDPEVMRFVPGGHFRGIGIVEARLKTYARESSRRGFSSWAVVERESGRVIGDAGFGMFQPTREIELGYTLARDCWGHGFATEAASACLAAGLSHLDAPRIIAVVDEANVASQRVAERIGMTRLETIEAHYRPHVLFEARSA
jgi:[ribosomal protein S5]-alanine N-acetyltransferase